MTLSKYKDDVIDIITDDIERLRTKPHMYISHTGKKGAVHLAKEAVHNAIDEAVNPNSPCYNISVELDENTNQFTVSDDGRGIQLDKVEDLCTYLQSGSNLHKENGDKKTQVRKAGEHGVGLTAINAFAAKLVFIIYQMNSRQKGIFTFEDSKLVNKKITDYSGDKHGTTVSFILDDTYLKTKVIDAKDLRQWLDYMAYLLPPKVKLTYTLIKKGKNVGVTEKLYHKNGIGDMLTEMVDKPLMKPVRINTEFNDGDTIDVAFNFNDEDDTDFTNHRSFCNYVNTVDDGEHVKAIKYAWCFVTSKLATEAMTENEKKKYPIIFDDCRQGLCAVINMRCLFPYFTGQTKQQVGNDELYKPTVKAVINELRQYFKDNPNELKKLVGIIKKNAKARIEVRKIKKAEFKKVDSFEAVTMSGYYPCSIYDNLRSEIYVCEGESAGGAAVGRRDKRYQAIFELRGNPKNVYGLTIPQVMENEELRRFFKVGEGGIGPSFNSKKFRFGKVIMFLDSDIDAYNMGSLFSCAMLWCAPQLVKEGRLYRTQAPLYLINDKKNPYITSKAKYFKLFADKIVANFDLIDSSGHKLTNKEIYALIERNGLYLTEVKSLQKYFYVDCEIFEFILVHRGEKNWIKKFMKKFEESEYDEELDMLSVIYKGSRMTLLINDNFYDKCKRLQTLITETNNNDIYYQVIDKGNALPGVYSLGSIFKMTSKYLPEVIERIKGVGELPNEVIWETVLNPQTRQLIRLTCEDLERELEIVKILHGNDASLRKDFMKGYIFNKEDLDT